MSTICFTTIPVRAQTGIGAAAWLADGLIYEQVKLLLRWTNDRFLATPHHAVNRTGGERYALAFFCDAQIDWPIATVPTCVGPGRPPRYETTYYTDYMIRYQARTYNVFDDQANGLAAPATRPFHNHDR